MDNIEKYGILLTHGLKGEKRPHTVIVFKSMRKALEFTDWLSKECE